MTRDRQEYWQAYINLVKDRLALRDWTIWLSHDPAKGEGLGHNRPEETVAEISVTYGRRQAVMYLGSGFEEMIPAHQRLSIVHELLHCHMDRVKHAYEHGINTRVHPEVFNAVYSDILMHLELGLDGIGDAIAHLVAPLPGGDGDGQSA